jgi:hypothetical protein
MPYRDPEPDDPTLLVGVSLPGDVETTREMARAMADEYARLGMREAELTALFASPAYAGPHRAWRLLGEGEVREIVRAATGLWSRLREAAGLRHPDPRPVSACGGHDAHDAPLDRREHGRGIPLPAYGAAHARRWKG